MEPAQNDRIISILGFRGVTIEDVVGFLKRVRVGLQPAEVQITDASCIAGKQHLFFAFLNAEKSFLEHRAISENLAMETLLYASGSRQISRAIKMLGIRAQTSTVAAIVVASSNDEVKKAEEKLTQLISGIRDDRVVEIRSKAKIHCLMKTFGVTDLELTTMTNSGRSATEALMWLIVERVSLLSIKR